MKRAGFTLIEVLVALALAAVALAAGMRALAQAADGAGTLKARTLALWVAQNRLAALQIDPGVLVIGSAQGEAQQANLRFRWTVNVGATPNPAFRRVDIVVDSATTMNRGRGFTLVEVLVALALLTLTATLAWQATSALVDGELRLTDEARRWRTLDLAFARFEADLRQAQPRPVRTPAGLEPAWLASIEANGASALVFTRAGPEFDPEPGAAGQRIGYRVRDAALEVVYWPSLDRARDESIPYRLVEGIAGFRVEQLSTSGHWLTGWPRFGESELPRAVRVVLTLDTGETLERWFALQ